MKTSNFMAHNSLQKHLSIEEIKAENEVFCEKLMSE